jgi:hypothetical protein
MAGYYKQAPRNDFIRLHFSDTFHFDIGQPQLYKGVNCFQSFPEGTVDGNRWVLVPGNTVNGTMIFNLGEEAGEFQLNLAIPRSYGFVYFPLLENIDSLIRTAYGYINRNGGIIIRGEPNNIDNPEGFWTGSFCYLANKTDGEGFDPPLAPPPPA